MLTYAAEQEKRMLTYAAAQEKRNAFRRRLATVRTVARMALLLHQFKVPLHYIYIYIYICMYVCMYVCMYIGVYEANARSLAPPGVC
jgi:hypothetical protein